MIRNEQILKKYIKRYDWIQLNVHLLFSYQVDLRLLLRSRDCRRSVRKPNRVAGSQLQQSTCKQLRGDHSHILFVRSFSFLHSTPL